MKKKKEISPAMRFLRAAWGGVCTATPHSWSVINGTMRQALSTAISGGMRFALGDYETLAAHPRDGGFNFQYWGGADYGNSYGEHFYGIAVGYSNRSAALSFEAWKKRKPFMTAGVSSTRGGSSSLHSGRSRLAVGSEFRWDGKRVVVTSFSEDGEYLTACVRELSVNGRNKVALRYKLTRVALKGQATA